jgi:hypothetical protein
MYNIKILFETVKHVVNKLNLSCTWVSNDTDTVKIIETKMKKNVKVTKEKEV